MAVALVTGYSIGAISPATLIARSRGADLRTTGSGNPGATNAGRVLGRKWGLAVAVLDVAKGAAPAALFGWWLHEAGLVAGAAAVVGHITSPLLRGRGGKGVATAGGAVLDAGAADIGWAGALAVLVIVRHQANFARRWRACSSPHQT